MSPFVLFIVLAICRCGHSWIFTDIDYKALERNVLKDPEESGEDYELTPEELARLRFSLIFPGTKWCGPGNVAEDYDDLGTSPEADRCCRQHDNCPDIIPAGETRFNLTNHAYYTRLSCNCDKTFHQCLRNASTKTSNTIGLMYFNIIGTKCYRSDYQIEGCKKKGGWLGSKCVEYSYNTSSPMSYQWFDVPNY